MRLPRLAHIAAAAVTSLALVLSSGIPAQAAQPVPEPTSFVPTYGNPGCQSFIIVINNCDPRDIYDATYKAFGTAMASNDPELRRGTINFMILTVLGNDLKNWESDPGAKANAAILQQLTSNTGDPSNSVLACYGNSLLKSISTFSTQKAVVENIYTAAEKIQDGSEILGTGKKVIKALKALGSSAEAQREEAEDLLDETREDRIKELLGIDDSLLNLYLGMFIESEGSTIYFGASENLRAYVGEMSFCEVGTNHLTPRPVTKTQTVRYSAQAMFKKTYAYDAKGKGKCAKVKGGALQCTTYDAKKNRIGGYALCSLGVNVRVPAAVKNAAKPGGVITAQMSIKVSKLKGAGYWDMGFGYLPKGTFKKAGTVKSPVVYLNADLLRNWVNYDFCLKPKTTATIKSIDITYRSTILKGPKDLTLN
jgi:hypothetical protein